jgi:hypothetical protein
LFGTPALDRLGNQKPALHVGIVAGTPIEYFHQLVEPLKLHLRS